MPFWSKVDRTFAEFEENGAFSGLYKIVDVVTTAEHPRTFYYKYYDARKPMPEEDDGFDYSLCTIVLTGGWADFAEGHKIANAISRSRKLNIPTSWHEMMAHPEKEFYLPAFIIERDRYFSTGTVKPGYKDIDWDNVDPASIGDLMLLFDKLKNPDGSLKKYKCRIVFRGDRCKNLEGYNRYASSVDMHALFLFLGIVACEDLDMWHQDVQTSFLYTDFPDGMRQYVRRPHGVPDEFFPYRFELGHYTYGHPLASRQWKEHRDATLARGGFVPIYSSG